MNINTPHSKNLDVLNAYCDLLTNKSKLRYIKIGKENVKCYIVANDGTRWLRIEQIGTRMQAILKNLENEVVYLKSKNKELRQELSKHHPL